MKENPPKSLKNLKFTGLDLIANHPANKIPLDNLTAIFMLLWNIWDNWNKAHVSTKSTSQQLITITSTEREFTLEFENEGVMDDSLVQYMNDKNIHSNPSKGQGTTDIKEIGNSITNMQVRYATKGTKTITTIIVKASNI